MAIDLTIKILIAISKLHYKGFGHFDIKSGNIFMYDDFTPLLADFGVSNTFLNNAL